MRILSEEWSTSVDRVTEQFVIEKLGYDKNKHYKNEECKAVYIKEKGRLKLTKVAEDLFYKYRADFERTVLKNIID